ncbi:MAG: hypothetical protein AVDCRST_MAG79-512, partial [uncultured Thermoleophilia bacterium]
TSRLGLASAPSPLRARTRPDAAPSGTFTSAIVLAQRSAGTSLSSASPGPPRKITERTRCMPWPLRRRVLPALTVSSSTHSARHATACTTAGADA